MGSFPFAHTQGRTLHNIPLSHLLILHAAPDVNGSSVLHSLLEILLFLIVPLLQADVVLDLVSQLLSHLLAFYYLQAQVIRYLIPFTE